jgi:hypothetical protein
VAGSQNSTVWILAVGGIGELFGISCWAYIGFGDLAGDTGEVGLVSSSDWTILELM